MKRVDILLVILIGIVSFLLLTIGIDKPFNGHHDFNNRFFSQVGRNYIKYGLLNLKLGQLIWDHKPEDTGEVYYTHHPPLLPIILSVGLKTLGDTNASVRVVPIVFSVLTLGIFYLLIRNFLGVIESLLGVGAWVISPMFLYFGKMADHEALTLFFITLTCWLFVLWKKSGDISIFHLLVIGLFLGQWTGWPAYYLAGILFIISRRWEFVALSLFNFALFVGNVVWITGSPVGGGLWEILLFRVGLQPLSFAEEIYTPIQFMTQELRWSYHFFTPGVVITTVLYLIYSLLKWFKNRKFDLWSQIWLVYFLVALIHIFFFQTGAWHHDYWLYYFLPFYGFGIAGMASLLVKGFRSQRTVVYIFFTLLLLFSFSSSQPGPSQGVRRLTERDGAS